jgi:ElaB/YqjD/DUF883 family membrane-anchored ribosome-binding protein
MFKTNARKRINNANHDLSNDLGRIRSALGEATYDVKAKIEEMLAQTLENASDMTRKKQVQLATFVHKKPMKALGIAAFAGIVIGYFLHR